MLVLLRGFIRYIHTTIMYVRKRNVLLCMLRNGRSLENPHTCSWSTLTLYTTGNEEKKNISLDYGNTSRSALSMTQ